jgi:hypothetical protein
MADTGVVDPIRVPAWIREPLERAWRQSVPLVRLFVGLAAIDVLSRAIGVLQPRYDLTGDLFGAYFMLVPHDLWILLPAVLVLRRPDAPTATPLVLWGAVTTAVISLVERPVENLFNGPYGPTNVSFEVTILAAIGTLLAYVVLARGLAALNPAKPTDTAAGLSNLVLGVGLIGFVFSMAQSFIALGQTGDSAIDGLFALDNVVAGIERVAWLYLLWIVIRGLGDTRRPSTALLVAVIGAAITGLFDPISSVTGAFAASLGGPSAVSELTYALGVLSIGVGQAMVLVAFALGLAEPPVPYVAPAAPAAGGPAPADPVTAEPPPSDPDPAILPG